MALSVGAYYKKHGDEKFRKKAQESYGSHRELPSGKNFKMWNQDHDPEADQKFRDNFDRIFPNSPGNGI